MHIWLFPILKQVASGVCRTISLCHSGTLSQNISVSGEGRNIFSSKRKITIRTFQHTPRNKGHDDARVHYVMSPLGRIHFLGYAHKGDIINMYSDWPLADFCELID